MLPSFEAQQWNEEGGWGQWEAEASESLAQGGGWGDIARLVLTVLNFMCISMVMLAPQLEHPGGNMLVPCFSQLTAPRNAAGRVPTFSAGSFGEL